MDEYSSSPASCCAEWVVLPVKLLDCMTKVGNFMAQVICSSHCQSVSVDHNNYTRVSSVSRRWNRRIIPESELFLCLTNSARFLRCDVNKWGYFRSLFSGGMGKKCDWFWVRKVDNVIYFVLTQERTSDRKASLVL